ncbi:MAG: SDR family oxidoreductase [Planctomycetes bacterium]|nr:SDR family oxidoreductase [Planctomycetota bacterium]
MSRMPETVLITGASSGIGLELARLFAADGADLVLVARRGERLEALAKELEASHGSRARAISKDLSDPAAPAQIAEALRNRGAAVDVVVNNAGFGALGRFAQIDERRQLDMVQLNVAALTHLTRLFLPAMIERRRGGILNVASTAAFQPGPLMSVYYATKAYVLSLTEGLAEELRGTGVVASCLCPGPTFTEFLVRAEMKQSAAFEAAAMSAKKVAKIGYRGFRRGRVVVVPGAANRMGTLLVRAAPRWLARRVTFFLNS